MKQRKRNMNELEFQNWIITKLIPKENGCLEWSGCKNKDGYATVTFNHKGLLVHRYILGVKLGYTLEPNKVTRHLCHNRACCNKDHLEEGTVLDNVLDNVRANRQAKGERNGTSKLTENQVIEIRENKDNIKQIELCKMYNLSRSQIHDIQNNKAWRHLK